MELPESGHSRGCPARWSSPPDKGVALYIERSGPGGSGSPPEIAQYRYWSDL
jgi:hypothetical protein